MVSKIKSGEKTIESRWYLHKVLPWGNIEKGDIIYFKNSGEPIELMAQVRDVLQFEDLTQKKVDEIIQKYGQADGLDIGKRDFFYELFKNKKYCLLIFLEKVKTVEHFEINKKGFGSMTAWITLDDIDRIKRINVPKFKQTSLLRKSG